MDPTIQTAAQEAAERATDKVTAEILEQNVRIREALLRCSSIIRAIGKPDLFQCKGYDFEDMLDMLTDITPTPNAKHAREFANEWGNRT